ncbi:MAG: hypothetical protein KBG64_02000 [Clostridia bacterium]|nr:hypothetical protein [Clostridia bacterium]
MITLSNEWIKLGLSEVDGSILLLTDLVHCFSPLDCHICEDTLNTPPFLIWDDGDFSSDFIDFKYDLNTQDNQNISLTWLIAENIFLEATIQLQSNSVLFRSKLINESGRRIAVYQYPLVCGIAQISKKDYLVHSYATGLLIENPLSAEESQLSFLKYIPYPEGFSGATMQFFSYYGSDRGGLYFAAEDPNGRQKWLNCYPENGYMNASLMIGYEDMRDGQSHIVLSTDYDFKISFMSPNPTWQEAADLYKEWAVHQPWCQKGIKENQSPKQYPKWLYEDVGLVTFGVNAGHDRSKWLNRYHQDIGSPIFHILGPDWTNKPQTFGSGVPGGLEDWLPTRFSEENLETIRNNGDYYAPFEFDFLVSLNQSDQEKLKANLIKWPVPVFSHDSYRFNMLCPCSEFTQKFHVERDAQIYREAQPDSMYYDISANNLIRCCLSEEHGHIPGAASQLTACYQKIYDETRNKLSEMARKPIPLGTELINELFIPQLDYYQARAWAQPSSTLETWPLRPLMVSGQARMVPLFTYVYHEYGVVRCDGWGKLVEETGDYFYDIVAKTYLWGGLYELNHEYSPMEELDGIENSQMEHYFRFKPRHYSYCAERACYVRQFAALRVKEGHPYLGYGKMLRDLNQSIPCYEAKWFQYNHGENEMYQEQGSYEVPLVRTSVWSSSNGSRLAIFMVNTGKEDCFFSPMLDLIKEDESDLWSMTLFEDFDPDYGTTVTQIGNVGSFWPNDLCFSLKSRKVYMLELTRNEGGN